MKYRGEEATHFIARPRKHIDGGFAITIYSFDENHEGSRPRYCGPLGWSNHMSQKDSDVIKELRPLRLFSEVTGDTLNEDYTGLNIYAG